MITESPILQYFEYSHLRSPLAEVSMWFHELAWQIERMLPPGAEKSTALRKLLEAKDAAVRAALALPFDPPPAPDRYRVQARAVTEVELP